MKTNLLFFRKLFFLVSIFYFASLHAFGQSHASLIMDNCAVVANNEIQFDVSVLNDGTTALNFNSIVIRFTHNVGITSGGSVSWGMIAGSSSLPNFGTGSGTFVYISSTRLASFSSGSAIYTSSTSPALPYGVPVKIGRYFLKVTGGVFNVGAAIGLSWHSLAGIVVWEGGSPITGSMLPSSNKLTQVPPCSIVIPNLTNCSGSLIATTTDVSAICATDGTATINLDPLPQSIGGTYSLDGGSLVNYTSQPIQITGLAAGPHQIVVNNGTCPTLSTSFNVGGQGSTPYTISYSSASQCDTNIIITLVNAPANTSGTYSISGGQALPFSSNPFTISTNNNYFFLVVNATCVQFSSTYVNLNIDQVVPSFITNSSNCGVDTVHINFQNGATVSSTGQYRLNNGAWLNYTALPFTINSLPGGLNTIDVNPSGCARVFKKAINLPIPNSLEITTTSSCSNYYSSNGTALINYSFPPQNTAGTYQVDGGSTHNFSMMPFQLTGLSWGVHTITVNNNTCPTSLTSVFTIDKIVNPLVFQNIVGTCSSASLGSVSVNFVDTTTITSGYYRVDLGPSIPFSSLPITISGLSAGLNYITLENYCFKSSDFVMIPGTYSFLQFNNYIMPTCYGGNDGAVTVSLINSSTTSGYYHLDGGVAIPFTNTAFAITGLTAGSHSISLDTICLEAPSYTFNISNPNQLATTTYQTACLSYTWPLSGNTYTVSGTYTYNTTNSNGCVVQNNLNLVITNNTLSNAGILSSSSPNLCISNLQNSGNLIYGSTNCELLAQINSNSTLGNTQVCVNFLTNPTWNTEPYANRVYSINPSIQPVGGATVKLYYSASDLASAGISNNSQISITKVGGNGLLGGSGAVEEITNSMMTITNLSNGYKEVSFPVTSFSTFYLHSKNYGNAVLPVTYVNFSGRKMGANDLIEWSTANEENNQYFNLQYSTDAINFKTIEKVESKCVAGIESLLDYSYTHTATANGHNYYRLEQVDIDGRHSLHSKVIDVWHQGTNGEVAIYPNPANQHVYIDFSAEKAGNTRIKLFDISGRVVKEIQLKNSLGQNHVELNLASLPQGVYRVQVSVNNQLLQTRSFAKSL